MDMLRNMLVICSTFPNLDDSYLGATYVKDLTISVSKYFENVYVINPILYTFKLSQEDKLLEDYSIKNIAVYYPRVFLPVSGEIPNFFRDIAIKHRLKSIVQLIDKKEIKFDIIHAHFTYPPGYLGYLLKKKYNKPLVVTIHENREWFLKEVNSGKKEIYKTWKNADLVIRVNKSDLKYLRKFNKNSIYIPNGFSKSRFYPIEISEAREKLGIPLESKIIFSLGALIERKGFQFLIQAMKDVIQRNKNVICYIGGDGGYKRYLESLIRNLGLQKYVKLVGFIPNEGLNLWMNACDVFVLPSLSESFGVVQIEAMVCGKPVVATRNGGSEEIIISEEYGLLCKSANPEDLAEKILTALDKEWDSRVIRKYAERFTWDSIARQVIEVYNKF